MSAGDVMVVTLKVAGPDGELLINTHHYKQTAGGHNFALTEMDHLADAFDAVLAGDLMSLVSTTCQYGETLVRILTGASAGNEGRSVFTAGTAGTSLGTPGSIERCVVYRKLTGIAGRKNRGRVFTPMPCLESFANTGAYVPTNPDAAAQGNYLADLAGTIDTGVAFAGTIAAPVVWHRGTLSYTDVNSVQISNLVGVQRRRRVGIGA